MGEQAKEAGAQSLLSATDDALVDQQEDTCSRSAEKLQRPHAVPDASLLGCSPNTDTIYSSKAQNRRTKRKVSEQDVCRSP